MSAAHVEARHHDIRKKKKYKRKEKEIQKSKKKKCKKAKWLSEEALQMAVKRREVKSKREKER